MTPQVVSYAGSRNPEHPRSFIWHGDQYTVKEIIARRREPDGLGFMVLCSPGNLMFDLFYNNQRDEWLITPKGKNIHQEPSETSTNL